MNEEQETQLVETIHYQPGPKVYIHTYGRIYDMEDPSFVQDMEPLVGQEIVGFGQGDAIETRWYDGTNVPYVHAGDPHALMDLGNKIKKELADAFQLEEKEVQGKKIIRIIIRGTNGRE